MPDLFHSLQGRDLEHLRIVASLWGVDLTAPDAKTALPLLAAALLDRERLDEMVETLPTSAQNALQSLLENEGRQPWAQFVRSYGPFREMGPGKRDRERPWLNQPSPIEMLWYRALIGRAFFAVGAEPVEFAYLPDDLLALLPPIHPSLPPPPGRPASPVECALPLPANDSLLDTACTLLAALRLGESELAETWMTPGDLPPAALQEILLAAELLDENGTPLPDAARDFLEAPRGEALALLCKAWLHAPTVNDLRHTPGLVCEGEWRNDPLRARDSVLDFLTAIPPGIWWNLNNLISDVHEIQPDFQRSAGEYDSWLIRRAGSDESLAGFAHWNDVDGALLRYLITGPLHALGVVDLAKPAEDQEVTAFRTSTWSSTLLNGDAPGGLPAEDGTVQILPDGLLRVPLRTPRAVRYQLARFCDWEDMDAGEFHYRITPVSLARARKQGLRPGHLETLLRRNGSQPPTPALVQALNRWDTEGTQAALQTVSILRVTSPEIMTALRGSRAARFLSELLGPTTAVIKPGAQERLRKALAEMGYLADMVRSDEDPSDSTH